LEYVRRRRQHIKECSVVNFLNPHHHIHDLSAMSSAGKIFGTQSPPLEATGSEKPMSVSSVRGGEPEFVADAKQREQYFPQHQGQYESSGVREAATQLPEKLKKD